VVESTDAQERDDLSSTRRFDSARDRRIARKRYVGPVLVVIGHVLVDQTEQTALSNTMSWSSSSRRSVPTHRSANPFCQREARRDPQLLNAQVVHSRVNSTHRCHHGRGSVASLHHVEGLYDLLGPRGDSVSDAAASRSRHPKRAISSTICWPSPSVSCGLARCSM
jgi:hypothetical protein